MVRVRSLHGGLSVVFLVVALGGCYRGSSPAMGRSPTTHSAVPCLEACGSDEACRRQCQPTGNLPPPPGIVYQR